jgi:anti-sigma factor RsiW
MNEMTPDETRPDPADGPSLRCERVRLLLSMQVDGEATPAQAAEIAEHLPACAGCRSARDVDLAVREQFRIALEDTPTGGLAERVTGLVHDYRREARQVHRLLVGTAAAAVMLAAGVGVASSMQGTGPSLPPTDSTVAAARASARVALIPPPAIAADQEGR